MNKPSILIVGAGAIGSFYGALLARAGCPVDVVVRSDYNAVLADGFRFESPLGDLSWRPKHVYQAGDPADTLPDYLILSTKVTPSIDRIGLIQPWIGAQTRVVLIQNGLGIEREIVSAFPEHPLISCIAFIAVSRTAPGSIRHRAYGNLVMGNFPKGITSDTEQLADLFQNGGVAVKLTDEVVRERWIKCVWNTPFNPLSVLANGADTDTMLNTEDGEALVRAMMAELIATAHADGYDLPAEKLIESNIRATRKMGPYKNSMALDYLNGRPIELDAILGNVLAVARKHGVSVPHLETVLTSLRMRH